MYTDEKKAVKAMGPTHFFILCSPVRVRKLKKIPARVKNRLR